MNRLSGSASPYLRQHAGNPVEWYPWGEGAFERARTEGKPLFVSIGYAACHWCHVMAHESFEDQATADDLSRWFVSVKVDREERPDVDAAYMAAVQAMTGAGGWPMSVFCTPDGRPFFGGTYFPPVERHGLPSFRRVLSAIAGAWADRRDEIDRQADALRETLQARLGSAQPGTRVEWDGCLASCVEQLASRYDERWGGFGPAPKFPRPTLVELCLRRAVRHGDSGALQMATRTLDAMAAGGIYDHLAGGFARYSTDRFWMVPHFEKMLTDQALLSRVYLRAWQVTKNDAYLQVASETIDFVSSELWREGFCSSLDADAGGLEGSHATWTPGEVRGVLGHERSLDACQWFSITDDGSFEGRSVLHRPLGAPLRRPPEIESARLALLEARRRRPQPARDDKILTEWNAMFLAVLAEAAAVTANDGWAALASRGAALLFEQNRRTDGRWLRAASSDVPAFAADYAWLVECCCRMAELTGQARWTERAGEIAEEMLGLFASDDGTFRTVGHDAETLYLQPPDVIDGAIPSASSIGAQALVRAGALTGSARLADEGARIVEAQSALLSSDPAAVCDLLPALAMLDDGAEVVVVGDRPDLRDALRHHWLPDAVVAWGEPTPSLLWEGRAPGAAYVCRKYACLEPARDVSSLEEQLLRVSRGGRL